MAFITPGQVSNISKKPITTPTGWTRPVDWPTIIDDTNKIQFLVSDIGTQSSGTASSYSINTIFSRTGGTYSVYIDWGDGTSDQVSTTTTTTSHNYTTGGATCSRGYNTWIITVTVDPTVSLFTCNLVPPVNLFSSNYLSSGLLEIYHGDTIGLSVNWAGKYGANTTGAYTNLEYVKMPSTWNGTSLSSTFYQCSALQSIILPVTMNGCMTIDQCFLSCTALQVITLPTSCSGLSNMSSCFQNCNSLYSVIFPMTSLPVSNMTSCFNACSNMDNLILPNFTSTCSWVSTFNNCGNLTNIRIGSFNNGTTQTFQQTFCGCTSMVRCDMKDNPAVRPNLVFDRTFTTNVSVPACQSLPNFVFPTCNLTTTVASAFSGCSSITTIDTSKCLSPTSVSWSNSFANCYNLISMSIPPMTTGGSPSQPSNFQNTFIGCASLVSVDLSKISLVSLTIMSGMFFGCFNLLSVSFPSESAPVLTTIASLFGNCYSLTSVTLPTGLNAVTTAAQAFLNCYSLKSVSFPTTMSALTAAGLSGTFWGCRELQSVTLPTTVNTNGITNMTQMFQSCVSLQSVDLPTIGSGVTNLSSSFLDTWSLKTITFNGSLTNAAIDFSNAFTRSAFSSANFGAFSSTATLVNGTTMGNQSPFCATYSFSTRFSKLDISGTVAIPNGGVRSLRLPAVALTGQWGGSSPQINISYTGITYANLVSLFNDLAAQGNVTSKTINITGCTGASSLTAGDRLIITSKGWTITG
jgi:hypothetical protein